MPRAVVLVVDCLQAGQLGCYGNTWVDTPALNRLAAEGFVFDAALADTLELPRLYRGLWRGVHALADERSANQNAWLPGRLAAIGVRQTLVSDSPGLFAGPEVEPFAQHLVVPLPEVAALAATVDATHTARFFSAAAEALTQADGDQLLWLHAAGLAAPWDAPLELREQLRDDEDPPPRDTSEVPCEQLDEDHDPDELLRVMQAYAAQVTLLDHGWQWFEAELARSRWAADTLVIVAGARGFALGEHGWIGPPQPPQAPGPPLHGELLHVPLLVRLPNGEVESLRSSQLVQPADLCATLAAWFGLEPPGLAADHPAAGINLLPHIRGASTPARRLAVAADATHRLLRTPAWQWIAPASAPQQASLYVKPDDRWEVNDVAQRAAAVTEAFSAAWPVVEASLRSPDAASWPELPAELFDPPE